MGKHAAPTGDDGFMDTAPDPDPEITKPGVSRSPSTWLVMAEGGRTVYQGRTEQDILEQLVDGGVIGTFELWPLRNSATKPAVVTLKEQTTLVVEVE